MSEWVGATLARELEEARLFVPLTSAAHQISPWKNASDGQEHRSKLVEDSSRTNNKLVHPHPYSGHRWVQTIEAPWP